MYNISEFINPILKEILAYSQSFWPESSTLTPTGAICYNFRDELTYYDGIIIKGFKIVIPEPMRKEMLRKIPLLTPSSV